jgi:Effector-associated domain 11
MPFLETAAEYILGIITKNEEVKKFPAEFINESVLWVKSWFLKPEDSKTNAKLEDPNKPIEVKKDIIQDKLDDLKDNPQFVKELTEKLNRFEKERNTRKNYLGKEGSIESDGKVVVGDTGASVNEGYTEKNVIEGKIKAKGDVRIGDEIVSNSQVTHNYYGVTNPSQTTPPQYNDLKSVLKALLRKGETADVIERLLDLTDNTDKSANDTVLILSGQFNRLNTQETKGTIGRSDAEISRNRLNDSLVSVINDLEI